MAKNTGRRTGVTSGVFIEAKRRGGLFRGADRRSWWQRALDSL